MTKLSPLEETLFQSWATAHGVKNHDDPKNFFDHRGLYKQTNGLIMPGHVVRQMADTHNKAMEPQDVGPSVENPDPFMAAAEMHGNELKAKTDLHKEAMKSQLEDKKHQQKLQLEHMKLQHTSMEKEKDRAHKAQEAQQARVQHAQEVQQSNQMQMQEAERNRQQQVQDAQMNREHSVQDKLLQEHMARTRSQPSPAGGQPQVPQGPPQSGGSSLQQQLMQRAMGGGQ